MKIRLTLEADPRTIVAMLKAMRGNCALIGERLASVIVTGEVGFEQRVGLESYGVSVVALEKMTEQE